MSIKLIIPVKTTKNAVTSHLWRTDNLCHDKALFCDKKLERHEENVMDKQISSSEKNQLLYLINCRIIK